MEDIKFYTIESKSTYYGFEYRFVSLYNGSRGPWSCDESNAIEQGNVHEKIIKSIYNLQEN